MVPKSKRLPARAGAGESAHLKCIAAKDTYKNVGDQHSFDALIQADDMKEFKFYGDLQRLSPKYSVRFTLHLAASDGAIGGLVGNEWSPHTPTEQELVDLMTAFMSAQSEFTDEIARMAQESK